METLVILKCLLILILTSVSLSGQSPSGSEDSLSEPDYVKEWKNYNKLLRNESNSEKISEGANPQDRIAEKNENPLVVVFVQNPVRPSVHKKVVSQIPSPSNGAVVIFEEEVILVPNKNERDYGPKDHRGKPQAEKDKAVRQPSEDANSSGVKPGVVGQTGNGTLKSDERHSPLNKTIIVGGNAQRDLGNYTKGRGNDTKGQKPPPKGHYILIDDDNPHSYSKKGKSGSKPGGNFTRINATVGPGNIGNNSRKVERVPGIIRWFPLVSTDKPPHGGENSTGLKPSVIDKSLKTTKKNNGTLNKTETVDNKSVEHPRNRSKGRENDSKSRKPSRKIDTAPIDDDNPFAYSNKGKSDSKNGKNSTKNHSAVPANDRGDGLLEVKRNNDNVTFPMGNDTFDGNFSHTAKVHFLD